MGLPDDSQRQIVRNEGIFREVNERMQARAGATGNDSKALPFFCECGHASCTELVRLTAAEYEEIRTHPRWFFLLPGHEIPEAESIVARHDGYVVVEKTDEAGRLAAESDPRS